MDNKNNNLFYLYCVADKSFDYAAIQSSHNDFYFIPVQSYYAVVSKVTKNDFGREVLQENIKNFEWLEKFAKKHEYIIEYVMKQNINVIPFKFATLFFTEENLISSLAKQESVIEKNFAKLNNKEEWGLKTFCNTDIFSNELIKTNQEIIQLDNEVNSATPGKAYILKKKRKELLKNTMINELNLIKSEFLKEIEKTTLKVKLNKNLPKTATGRQEEMILNAVFLIEKTKVTFFKEKVSEFKFKGVSFEPTGPWPPYNFIELQEI